MDDFNFNSWAKKQTKYFGDPSTGNRNDLKMDISNCAMTIQQWEHIKNSYFLIIILCCIVIIVILFVLILFSCYENHNRKKRYRRSPLNIE